MTWEFVANRVVGKDGEEGSKVFVGVDDIVVGGSQAGLLVWKVCHGCFGI